VKSNVCRIVGLIIGDRDVKDIDKELNLRFYNARVCRVEFNRFAEVFHKAFKWDYTYQADGDSAEIVLN
jgi:hypothetical protein